MASKVTAYLILLLLLSAAVLLVTVATARGTVAERSGPATSVANDHLRSAPHGRSATARGTVSEREPTDGVGLLGEEAETATWSTLGPKPANAFGSPGSRSLTVSRLGWEPQAGATSWAPASSRPLSRAVASHPAFTATGGGEPRESGPFLRSVSSSLRVTGRAVAAQAGMSRAAAVRLEPLTPPRIVHLVRLTQGKLASCDTKACWKQRALRAEKQLAAQADLVFVARTELRRLYERWRCIHEHEGAWADPDSPHWGGVQANLDFMLTYGREFYRRWGTADRWPVYAQLVMANRGWEARGWAPWPRTAAACGLLP